MKTVAGASVLRHRQDSDDVKVKKKTKKTQHIYDMQFKMKLYLEAGQ